MSLEKHSRVQRQEEGTALEQTFVEVTRSTDRSIDRSLLVTLSLDVRSEQRPKERKGKERKENDNDRSDSQAVDRGEASDGDNCVQTNANGVSRAARLLNIAFLKRLVHDMDNDLRYQWLERRLVNTIEPKRDLLTQFIANDDNRLV